MRRFSSILPHATTGLCPIYPSRGAQPFAPLTDFGHNPGQLSGSTYVPDTLAPGAPLVVVLHGCTQTADQYDLGAGWSVMADQHCFALLFPEQQRSNNPNLCFNWFLPQDNRRDRGEALSIRNMIAAMTERHQLDPHRIFITGLSAGGAMANAMLATYPELFAGGAIIAGLPYGTATNVPQALERMRGQGLPNDPAIGALLRQASNHSGPWPTISVWHGSSDTTVHPSNADAIVRQWRSVHALTEVQANTDMVDGHVRRTWTDEGGRACVTYYTITGMAHGTPVATRGPDACGKAGPYMLDKNISSTHHICRLWGLADYHSSGVPRLEPEQAVAARALGPVYRSNDLSKPERLTTSPSGPTNGVGKVIEDALRAAGLMR